MSGPNKGPFSIIDYETTKKAAKYLFFTCLVVALPIFGWVAYKVFDFIYLPKNSSTEQIYFVGDETLESRKDAIEIEIVVWSDVSVGAAESKSPFAIAETVDDAE